MFDNELTHEVVLDDDVLSASFTSVTTEDTGMAVGGFRDVKHSLCAFEDEPRLVK